MKIEGIPGNYYSHAFIRKLHTFQDILCECFHGSYDHAKLVHNTPDSNVLVTAWPVEIEDGIAYVPSEEELINEK